MVATQCWCRSEEICLCIQYVHAYEDYCDIHVTHIVYEVSFFSAAMINTDLICGQCKIRVGDKAKQKTSNYNDTLLVPVFLPIHFLIPVVCILV